MISTATYVSVELRAHGVSLTIDPTQKVLDDARAGRNGSQSSLLTYYIIPALRRARPKLGSYITFWRDVVIDRVGEPYETKPRRKTAAKPAAASNPAWPAEHPDDCPCGDRDNAWCPWRRAKND